jgi:hypothetical protein
MTDLRKVLSDLFLEDILEMSDEEIEEEIRAQGGDPKEIATRMRKRIEKLLERYEPHFDRPADPTATSAHLMRELLAGPRRCHECGERMGKDDTCPACGA